MKKDELTQFFSNGSILLFHKPLYWTSFDLVRKVKNILKHQANLKKLKVGHAGTLDPLATGLMVVCTGKETRNINQYQAGEKEYRAKIMLGATTPSFDLETEVDQHYPFSHITREKVESVINDLIGKQMQEPPLYSAKFVNGIRAYQFARSGQLVELAAKEIVIHDIQLLSFQLPVIEVRVTCSKGTYIRSLARDIGLRLASGAHLVELTRLRIGNFMIKDALNIEDFERNLVFL